jgi:hypothetical protein
LNLRLRLARRAERWALEGDQFMRGRITGMAVGIVALPFTVAVDTPAIVEQSMRDQLRGRGQFEWSPWEEAANYLLENHLSAEEALKYAGNSVAIEDRFENEITEARAWKVLGRSDEALAAQKKAFSLGSQLQIYEFARALQGFGEQDFPFEIFRENIQKDPNSWVAHSEQARIAVAAGDFATAVAQMKLAIAAAPESMKAALPISCGSCKTMWTSTGDASCMGPTSSVAPTGFPIVSGDVARGDAQT